MYSLQHALNSGRCRARRSPPWTTDWRLSTDSYLRPAALELADLVPRPPVMRRGSLLSVKPETCAVQRAQIHPAPHTLSFRF